MTIDLMTMDQFQYDRKLRVLNHLPSGTSYSDYVGVGKISVFGKPSVFQELSKIHGSTKAKKILQSSIERGNNIHSRIQHSDENLLPELGLRQANEVFVYGSFDPDLPDVQGAIDCVYRDFEGNFHLVEIKSKSNYYSWIKYKEKNIGSYFRQVSAYDHLFKQTYNITPTSCTLVIMFGNNNKSMEKITLTQSDLFRYKNEFFNNLRNFSLTL